MCRISRQFVADDRACTIFYEVRFPELIHYGKIIHDSMFTDRLLRCEFTLPTIPRSALAGAYQQRKNFQEAQV
jgi:hypothetical protein